MSVPSKSNCPFGVEFEFSDERASKSNCPFGVEFEFSDERAVEIEPKVLYWLPEMNTNNQKCCTGCQK